MMRFLLLLCVVVLISGCQDRTDPSDLKKIFEADILAYGETINQKDYDKMIGMINPKLFDFVSKE